MRHILVVEDEEFLAITLKDNLEAEGCSVSVAHNGEAAIACVRAKHPDLILLDLLMPLYDGYYALAELKKNNEWKDIPVIVLSNFGNDDEIKRAMKMGAEDYFVKSQHMIVEVLVKVDQYLDAKEKLNIK